MNEVLKEKLGKQQYSVDQVQTWTREVSEAVKQKLKGLAAWRACAADAAGGRDGL